MRAALALLLCAGGMSACEPRRTITGEAQQLEVVVRVSLSAQAAVVGQALGWPPAAVPDALVHVERVPEDLSEPMVVDTVVSDGLGVARFVGLPAGRYELRALRTFSEDERTRAASALGDADGLVGRASLQLGSRGTDTLRVDVTLSGGSSLLFTEITPAALPGPSGSQYYEGGYLEIFNNADTTIEIAGKLFFDAYGGYIRSSVHANGCNYFLPMERDPGGVWTRFVYRFPPQAKPLAPGRALVVATDAIDHRVFGGAGFLDLTRADFEFLGPADVDNPLVPNMISVGPQVYNFGHGWQFRGGRQVWGLANPVDMDSLPRWTDLVFFFGTGVRIPAAALLDIVRYNPNVPRFDPTIVDCPSPILLAIDATEAVLLGIEDTLVIRRRIARTLPDGRVVFQRSRNSAADWIAGPGTPGKVP